MMEVQMEVFRKMVNQLQVEIEANRIKIDKVVRKIEEDLLRSKY